MEHDADTFLMPAELNITNNNGINVQPDSFLKDFRS